MGRGRNCGELGCYSSRADHFLRYISLHRGARNMSRDPGLKTVVQIGIVCRDIEATAKRWSALLGIEMPTISMTDPGNQAGMVYLGRPSNAQCKLAFFDTGTCRIELIQPLGPESSWQDRS